MRRKPNQITLISFNKKRTAIIKGGKISHFICELILKNENNKHNIKTLHDKIFIFGFLLLNSEINFLKVLIRDHFQPKKKKFY